MFPIICIWLGDGDLQILACFIWINGLYEGWLTESFEKSRK